MNPDKLKSLLLLNERNSQASSFSKDEKRQCRCGKSIAYNGLTSHGRVCSYANDLKIDFLKNKYHIEEKCPICGKDIEVPINERVRGTRFIFCSNKCLNEARSIVTKNNNECVLQCVICGTSFKTYNENKKTCSVECSHRLLSSRVKEWHKDSKDNSSEAYIERNNKIRKSRIGRYKGNTPWNKGMRGEEYTSYFNKSDGTNSLYSSLERNEKFFKKTSPEIKFEEYLKEIGVRFQYSFFSSNRQFDFLVSTKSYCFVIEIDGDYWHKSRRLEFDEKVISEQRLLDEEKGRVIEKIKSEKLFILIRIWEYHISNDVEIWNHLKQLFEEENVNENLSKIKEYYQVYY